VKIQEVMTEEVELAEPDDTLETAARMMADLDVGVLPVIDGGRLSGMLTDRDITVRATAAGIGPDEGRVRDFMTTELCFCTAADDVAEVARKMEAWQVRRLPVIDGEQRVIGIVSLGDLATAAATRAAAEVLRGVSGGAVEDAAPAYAGDKPGAANDGGGKSAQGGSGEGRGVGPDDLTKGGF
jgi:CBS domain-containing protein